MFTDTRLTSNVDILSLLGHIEDYVLIKMDADFPAYQPGNDIDLIVFDREHAIGKVYEFHKTNVGKESELGVTNRPDHCHIDFLLSGKLDLRIDLIDNLDIFERISIRPSFLTKVFKDRTSITVQGHRVYVPSPEDDLTIRYFEYVEWFERRPDKIKHIEHISAVEDEELKQRFFENTHRYIQLRSKTWSGPVPVSRGAREILQPRRAALNAIQANATFLLKFTLKKWLTFLSKPQRKS